MYTVRIKRNSDGKEVDCPQKEFDWDESSEFWWSEGNMSCDCNRHLEFERNSGNNTDESECSEGRYSIVHIKLPDGQIVYTEEDTSQEGGG